MRRRAHLLAAARSQAEARYCTGTAAAAAAAAAVRRTEVARWARSRASSSAMVRLCYLVITPLQPWCARHVHVHVHVQCMRSVCAVHLIWPSYGSTYYGYTYYGYTHHGQATPRPSS